MSDWFMDNIGWVLLVLIILIITVVIFGCIEENKNSALNKKILVAQGYDIPNVSVFLKNSGYSYEDLVNSSALQNEYYKFVHGEASEFMKEARVRHSLKEAKDSANTAVAMSAASMGMSAAAMNR